jgi:2-amino-4-hydroxy-6-hydroxymethyldihydropteridine diphosphokinase
MAKVYLGLGSNIGDKLSNIRKAINYAKKKMRVTKISPIYKTEPVGYKKQDWFLNCVIEAKTDSNPSELLAFLKSIEKKLKRKKTFRYGPRTIDIDILFYNNRIIKSKNLQVPHPRMHRRFFVLEPLSKISPNFIHPKLKKTIVELKNEL